MRRGPFFFFFFFFFLLFNFQKPQKFVLGLPKWDFSTGEKHFRPGKKSGKMTLPPLKNVLVTPLLTSIKGSFIAGSKPQT